MGAGANCLRPQKPPCVIKQAASGRCLKDNVEEAPIAARWRCECSHTMPSLRCVLEEEAPIIHNTRCFARLEVTEVRVHRRGSLAAEHQRRSTPGRLPFVTGIEVENVGPELVPGIEVRRNLGPCRADMPRIARSERRDAERSANEVMILVAPLKLVNETLPCRRKLALLYDPLVVVSVIDRALVGEVVPIVRTLTVFPNDIGMIFKQFERR